MRKQGPWQDLVPGPALLDVDLVLLARHGGQLARICPTVAVNQRRRRNKSSIVQLSSTLTIQMHPENDLNIWWGQNLGQLSSWVLFLKKVRRGINLFLTSATARSFLCLFIVHDLLIRPFIWFEIKLDYMIANTPNDCSERKRCDTLIG